MPSGLPTTVTIRSRLSRSISVGPAVLDQLGEAVQLDRPTVGEGNVIWYRSWLVERLADAARSQTSYCWSPSRNLETGSPPDQHAERVGDRADRDAQVARRLAVDQDLDLGLPQRQGRVEVHQPRLLLQLGDQPVAVFRELVQVRAGEVDLERLRPPAALERRDVVDAHPQVGVILEELPRLLLDGELVEHRAVEIAADVAREVPPAADRRRPLDDTLAGWSA